MFHMFQHMFDCHAAQESDDESDMNNLGQSSFLADMQVNKTWYFN